MIGIGKFGLANLCFLCCGVMVVAKVAVEAFAHRTRLRGIALAVTLLLIPAMEYGVLSWTKKLSNEADDQQNRLKRLDDIPKLNDRLKVMEDARKAELEEKRLADAKSGQKLDDIKQENKDLRKSVETKDAALISIAKDQYALNFFPQILVSTNGTNDSMFIINNGKTNIITYKYIIDGGEIAEASKPSTLAPGDHHEPHRSRTNPSLYRHARTRRRNLPG